MGAEVGTDLKICPPLKKGIAHSSGKYPHICFFGILQPYIIDIYGFYLEEYMPGYLLTSQIPSNPFLNQTDLNGYPHLLGQGIFCASH